MSGVTLFLLGVIISIYFYSLDLVFVGPTNSFRLNRIILISVFLLKVDIKK